MKKMNTILSVGAVAAACSAANAGMIAAWDFQTTTNGGTAVTGAYCPKVLVSNFGSGTIYLDGTNGSGNFNQSYAGGPTAELTAYSGTSINADASIGMSTVTGTGALALLSNTANGKAMVFKFNMTNLASLGFTFAAQRTSAGFTGITIETSQNGTNWNTWTTLTSTSSGSPVVYTGTIRDSFVNSGVISVASTSSLDGAATAFVRFTFSGATSASGNNRLDNFIFSANAVPAPGAAALLGLAGLITSRRRK